MKHLDITTMPAPANQTIKKVSSVGLCLGASTISVVMVEGEKDGNGLNNLKNKQIINYAVHYHNGDPKQTLKSVLTQLEKKSFDTIATTGRKLRKHVNLPSISEPEAVEYAYKFVKPPDIACPAIVSAGGETFMVYALDSSDKISNVYTGNKCASGTGEFFLQQLRRMDVTLEEAAQWMDVTTPYHVSGRCSVFCKSDCTHATNKGIPKPSVTAGLCRMMSGKILELLGRIEKRNIMITGGTALNRMMIAYLRQEIPGLIVPVEAPYFEALGAALWAMEKGTPSVPVLSSLFKSNYSAFNTLVPLRNFTDMVTFKTVETAQIKSGDTCLLGLDVGSTTTKAVLLRKKDNAILEKIYLRTNGDPVGASRKCYHYLFNRISQTVDPTEVIIHGLGVCGSGRQIAGLHAQTDGIINEIIAHAAAAVYFDSRVDTIFEIGGQDAKYTYITNGVASDYAMNEACSAGTGSFLEESAYETLGVEMEDIADIALKGNKPPNFNDQCAAFITSDIKNAIHEGIQHEDIIAGLTYSICMNYTNRVKGNRPVGEKIFMQGGVCYNRAVPLAMASLTGKPIIVPPEPGLMGAFGAALEVKKRIENRLVGENQFDLQTLMNREMQYGKSFICKGGKEKCDRQCEIATIRLDGNSGKLYPFGGACNRYYNLRQNISCNVEIFDLVKIRQQLVFKSFNEHLQQKNMGVPTHPRPSQKKNGGKIGINRSFMVNTYYPLYSTFFRKLGFDPVMPNLPAQEGIDKKDAAFCYPAELAHGFFHSLIHESQPPDYIFLPHFKAIPSQNECSGSQVCPFVQGETYYLQTAFKNDLDALKKNGTTVLMPLLDLSKGVIHAKMPLIKTALQMGITWKKAARAFHCALQKQEECMDQIKVTGRNALAELESSPEKTAVVIFGRPYNAFAGEANMGIPSKFASRGITLIPMDFLPLEKEYADSHMYWGMGQMILKAAKFVERHPQLFGTYITNFSCGPDSFLISNFREIMGQKPSLTLELDSHTAGAGLETRIEAFLDIVTAYRQLMTGTTRRKQTFLPARTVLNNGKTNIVTSSGDILPITDPRVTLLLPSMGKLSTESFAAVFRGVGINAVSLPPSDETVLKLGRANTTCKECLPLQLTTGSLLNHIQINGSKNSILVYFMPTASGPCRFGQYFHYIQNLIKRLEIPDVALFSLSCENSYMGMKKDFHLKAWCAIVVSDIMEDIRSMILANAVDVPGALDIYDRQWKHILKEIEKWNYHSFEKILVQTATRLHCIDLKNPVNTVPTISLAGEIFVRRDAISRQYLTERLAEKGFAVVCAPVSEWLVYSDYMFRIGLSDTTMSFFEKLKFPVTSYLQSRYEKRIKTSLASSGLVSPVPLDVKSILNTAAPYISKNLTGEAALTVGSAISEVASHTCGVIAIGPFGCMPNRLSEAILNRTMNRTCKLASDPQNGQLVDTLENMDALPFLAIESDGNPFPQLIEAKLEAFCLRAKRLHERMMQNEILF